MCQENFYYDICDGSFYKDDSFFKEHSDALKLIIFHDQLEICNPLGSRAKKHKVYMYYYTLANLNLRFRSKHCAVRLIAICNASLIKKYGIDEVLAPIIEDLKLLYDGVEMDVGGKREVVYGKVVACTGDNEG